LVIGGTVYAATEGDSVYALRAADGHVLWRVHVGTPQPRSALPCGDIDPLGITSTPVFDAANGTVYALAETDGGHHQLVGIDAANGTLTSSREIVPPKGTALDHQQRAALTLLDGRVYVAFGGLAGDCGNYIGAVVAVPTTGTGPELSYAIPTARTGGIWTPGGATVHGDELLYSVGNGASTSGAYDGSDAVFALSPTLSRTDSFAPSTWRVDNANDLDLGSMTPALVGDHVVIAGKRGTGYVLNADRLGGIGGQLGEFEGCHGFGAAAIAAPTAYLPCTVGVTAVRVASDGSATRLWTAAVPATTSPVLGDGAVWSTCPAKGMLYALDPATGATRASLSTGTLPTFASPSLSRGTLYVGTTTGIVAVTA
jgi:outer membrane protein assembly factor BamB